ncbi:MAG: TonB-dependent receptor plug domain-containing protein [Panacagrimonas sp.]
MNSASSVSARTPLVALALLLVAGSLGAAQNDPRSDYLGLSIEDLMQVDVATVAGKPEPRFTTPAALTVISGGDIRRAGHRSVPEALRMIPGMFVARLNASKYAVGARGLTGSTITSSRYLVLVDGRVVVDPLTSVVLWDVVDLPIEDVDRIEVIRGPGATLWGANAMNGVINVITRSAARSQGTLLSVGPGDAESIATLRHGFTVGSTAVRAFARYADHSDLELNGGVSANDAFSTLRAGVRVDHQQDPRTKWTLDANLYRHPTADATVRVPVSGVHAQFVDDSTPEDISGGHVLMRMQRDFSADSGWSLQAYYDQVERDTSQLGVHRNTIDLDLRHWSTWGARNEFIWGAQFTRNADRLEDGTVLSFDPRSRQWSTLGLFAQNTTTLVSDRLYLMLGSKLNHHDFVGTFAQPGARLWWTPGERQTFWAAVSRPARVPSRLEEDGFVTLAYTDTGLATNMPPTGIVVARGIRGDDDLRVERMLAYELGHRYRFSDSLALDIAGFYNDYRRLIGVPPSLSGDFTDHSHGQTYGAELAVTCTPTPAWRLDASYSTLGARLGGPVLKFDEDNTPRHTAQVRSSWKARGNLEAHSAVYHVSRIDGVGLAAYTRLDLGLTWDVRPGVQVALWGQNLGDTEHPEALGVEVPRSFYAQLRFDL